jgi:nitrate reductase NapE component
LIETVKPSDAQKKSRRNRNVALGVVLAVLVVLFYVITLVKIGGLGN